MRLFTRIHLALFQIHFVLLHWVIAHNKKARLGGVRDYSTTSGRANPVGLRGGTHYEGCCTPSSCNCRVLLSQDIFLVLFSVDAGIYLNLKEKELIAACIKTITSESVLTDNTPPPVPQSLYSFSDWFNFSTLVVFLYALKRRSKQHWRPAFFLSFFLS